MPTLMTEPIAPLQPQRKKWTRAECEAAQTAGVDLERVELIEGELISKMPKYRPHTDAAVLLQGWLTLIFGLRFVNPEATIDVSPEDNPTNQPVPDIIVLKRSFKRFRSGIPQPADLDLVVEVSDSSLAFDMTTKAALYARAGIVEYWVLDVVARRLIVHRDPVDGTYRSVTAHGEHERVAPLAAPDAEFSVASAFLEE